MKLQSETIGQLASSSRADFLAAMRSHGLCPSDPSHILGDGQLHRFHVEGDKPGSLNGWAVLHLDGMPAGAFGSWKNQLFHKWCAKNKALLTVSEHQSLQSLIDQAKAQRNAELKRRHEHAATRAIRLLRESCLANPDHRYLRAKGIAPHQACQSGDSLVLPLYDFSWHLWSLQFISPEGDKKLLKDGCKQGCFIPVAGVMTTARVLICEGWATGATLAEHDPNALVLASVDAGNLKAVATGARNQWPDAEIVVCADADPVGREKGRAAAIAAGALLAVPEFPANAEGSDYNDLALLWDGGAL